MPLRNPVLILAHYLRLLAALQAVGYERFLPIKNFLNSECLNTPSFGMALIVTDVYRNKPVVGIGCCQQDNGEGVLRII